MATGLVVYECIFLDLQRPGPVGLALNTQTHTHHITQTAMFSCSLAQRYFSEKHDWSHEVWLLSCRAEPVMSDCPNLFSVGFVDSRSTVELEMMLVFVELLPGVTKFI